MEKQGYPADRVYTDLSKLTKSQLSFIATKAERGDQSKIAKRLPSSIGSQGSNRSKVYRAFQGRYTNTAVVDGILQYYKVTNIKDSNITPVTQSDREPLFKLGDRIQVSQDGREWISKIYLTEVQFSSCKQYIATSERDYSDISNGRCVSMHTSAWVHCRPEKIQMTKEEIAKRLNLPLERFDII